MHVVSRLSAKKQKRHESRKRKIQAFLDIAKSNDEDRKKRFQNNNENKDLVQNGSIILTENSCQNLEDQSSKDIQSEQKEYRTIKANVRERQRAKQKGPEFLLVDAGLAARHSLQFSTNPSSSRKLIEALYIQDLQHMLLAAMSQSLRCVTRWCRVLRPRKISHVVLLTVDGLGADDASLPGLTTHKNIFQENIVQFVDPVSYGSSFLDELLHVPLSLVTANKFQSNVFTDHSDTTLKPLSNVFPINTCCSERQPRQVEEVPRTYLLLSLLQMLAEGYPMPLQNDDNCKSKDYCFTKPSYRKVSDSSPIFAIDCEMCITNNCLHELTRISIVDEKLNVLYDTLVKPRNKITNYLTRYSGLTESMLKDVTTRLEDVQQAVCNILPDDAILCGQSLNFDLHAMKMMHPYVIDTSVIYNITGVRSKKSSLKLLTRIFLKSDIQCGKSGHDSVEDGLAAMELVKLKLSKSLAYGDVILGGEVPLPHVDEERLTVLSTSQASNRAKLLQNILDFGKSVCVLGTEEKVIEYVNGVSGEKMHVEPAKDCSKIVQRTVENAMQYDFTVAHLPVNNQSETLCAIVNNAIRDVYNACADRALVVVVFNAALACNGICMAKIK